MPSNQTIVASNGRHANGSDPEALDELIALMRSEPLMPVFWPWARLLPGWKDGGPWVEYFGNFETVSHVFSLRTSDPKLQARIYAALRQNPSYSSGKR